MYVDKIRLESGQDGEVERPWAHFSHNYTKSQQSAEQPLMKKMKKPEKIFDNEKHKEGTTTRWVGEAKKCS